MKKHNFILLAGLFLLACSPVPEMVSAGGGNFNPDRLREASSQECIGGLSLKENTAVMEKNFYELSAYSQVVGFMNGQDRCALTQDVNERTMSGGYFRFNIASSCLENGSVWKIVGQTRNSDSFLYTMKRVDRAQTTIMTMSATDGVTSGYAKNRIGMRAFNCK